MNPLHLVSQLICFYLIQNIPLKCLFLHKCTLPCISHSTEMKKSCLYRGNMDYSYLELSEDLTINEVFGGETVTLEPCLYHSLTGSESNPSDYLN